MPKLSAKRQITLPIAYCQDLGIEPGDEVDIYVHDEHITIVKQTPGRASGVLKKIKPRRVSEIASRDQALAARHGRRRLKS